MLKVMIIDDEFYFREALKVSIPWNELGFDICAEAKNGKDALEKALKLNPDIMLVDINMPIMDGLEFVRNVNEKGINSKIIILTGHSEFNYAKQAVQLGVNNYILKPVDDEELIKSLIETKKIIEKETSLIIEVSRLRQQVKDSLPLLRDKLLNELIQGSIIRSKDETIKKMEYLNINMHSEYYQVVAIELEHEESQKWNDEEKQLWKFAVSNISGEVLMEQYDFDICYDADDRICIIIGIKEIEDKNDISPLLHNRLELIRNAVQKHLGFTISIGAGNVKNDLFDIHASYKEALIALKNKLTVGKNKVILYSTVSDSAIKRNLFTGEHRSLLLLNLRTADETEVQKLIRQIFTEMHGENVHHDILFVVCIELVAVCLEYIVEAGLSLKDILPGNQLSIIEELQSKGSIEEMEGWIENIYRQTMELAKRNKSSKVSKLIDQVKNYIADNYHNDSLSIEEIASKLFVNYAHLCFIFKRDTGLTINEYLTELRIKKSKELFDSGNTLVLDVAAKVGYADANYFGKCFKKFYGLAPSKYIESKQQ
jgi:two-component system response regulator YesN